MRCSCFPFIMCPYTRSSAAPHSAKKCPQTRQEFFKKIIPFSVCLRIDSGSRDRDSGTRPRRDRQRKHDRQTADGKPRRRAKRKERLYGNKYHVQHPLFRAGNNRERREVTAQQVREGLRLTLNYLRQDMATFLNTACKLWNS